MTRLSEYLCRAFTKGTFQLRRLGSRCEKYPQDACRNTQTGVFRQPVTVAVLITAVAGIRLPSPVKHPLALVAGAMDATGAVCYLLATGWIRLDVAAVLSSLYPAIAVLLFRLVLHEAVRLWQWVGLALCVVAIALIAL